MDFNFSKEELLLRNSVREYVQDRIAPVADEADKNGPLSAADTQKYFSNLEPFGFIGSLAPTEFGGPGLSHVESGIIYHELGRIWAALAAAALCTSNFIAAVSDEKNHPVVSRLMPDLLSGKITGAVAVTEPDAGTDANAGMSTANPEEDGYVLTGEKLWVANGTVADILLVAVKTKNPDGPLQYILVEKGASSFYSEEIPKTGLKGLSTARLVFSRCAVPRENITGRVLPDAAATGYMNSAQCCLTAALATGLAAAALEKAVSYAGARMQFNKPLAQFQMIQKMIAGMAIGVDAAHLLCFRALKRLDEGADAAKEIAMAVSFALTAAVDITSTAIQVHGAYGYSDEFPIERYYRDACCLQMMAGIPEMHDMTVAEAVTGLSALI